MMRKKEEPATMEQTDPLCEQVQQEEEERERSRGEGAAGEKACGVRFGRPRREVRNIAKAYRLYELNLISATEAARLCGVARSTMYRRLREHKKELLGSEKAREKIAKNGDEQ